MCHWYMGFGKLITSVLFVTIPGSSWPYLWKITNLYRLGRRERRLWREPAEARLFQSWWY